MGGRRSVCFYFTDFFFPPPFLLYPFKGQQRCHIENLAERKGTLVEGFGKIMFFSSQSINSYSLGPWGSGLVIAVVAAVMCTSLCVGAAVIW